MLNLTWSPEPLNITIDFGSIEQLFKKEIEQVCGSWPCGGLQKITIKVQESSNYYSVTKNDVFELTSNSSSIIQVQVQSLDSTNSDRAVGILPIKLSLQRIKFGGKVRQFPQQEPRTLPINITFPSDPIKRPDVKQKLENTLKDEKIVWLYGVPKCGKTILLTQLACDSSFTVSIAPLRPIHISLKKKPKAQVRRWKLMYWIDQAIAKNMDRSIDGQELEYSTVLYSDPSIEHNGSLVEKTDPYSDPPVKYYRSLAETEEFLLILDGIYLFKKNPQDIYRTLTGLFREVKEDRGRFKHSKLLITDVISFKDRLVRLEHTKGCKQIAEYLAVNYAEKVHSLRLPFFDEKLGRYDQSEVYRLFQSVFRGNHDFPYKNFVRRHYSKLLDLTAGHPNLLQDVLRTSRWLYKRNGEFDEFKPPKDMCEIMFKRYGTFRVWDSGEKAFLEKLCENPDRIYTDKELDRYERELKRKDLLTESIRYPSEEGEMKRRLRDKGLLTECKGGGMRVVGWYIVGRDK